MKDWLVALLGLYRHRWYRRLAGGHWEQVYVDLPGCNFTLWFRCAHGERRPHFEHLEACEDWPTQSERAYRRERDRTAKRLLREAGVL